MPLQEIIAGPDQPRVILIGDQAGSRQEARSVLNAYGWVVTEASTTSQTMLMAQHDQPDVIILDLCEPEAHGTTMLAELKSSNETGWIPVVILSAGAGNGSAAALLQSGAQDYLRKPFTPHELVARLVVA